MDLVPFLAHANGWWRDTAQQLIIDQGDLSAVPALNKLAKNISEPLGQIHALWTLEGLGALNLEAVSGALLSMDPYVLESAIRLSELLPDAEPLLPKFVELSERPDLVVQLQLAASLGRIRSGKSL